jgi:hypothetical protein
MPPPQGIVIQMGIFGERNERAVSLLTVKNESIAIHDETLAKVLPRSDDPANTTVLPSLHERLEERYEDVYYYVDVRKLSENGPLIETKDGTRPKVPVVGSTPRYIISRETFGRLLVDDHIEYNLSLFERGIITAVTVILRNGVIKKKQPGSDSDSATPAYRITVSHGKRPDGDPVTLTYFTKPETYENAQVGSSSYFRVVFKNRAQPTIESFSPEPYGNL